MSWLEGELNRHLTVFDLEALLAIAETGSFRQAALQLGVGQPSISRRIRKIEDGLGISLFERHSGGARLTLAGSEFVACSSAIFENLKAAVTSAQASAIASKGKLRIGTLASFSNGPQRALTQRFARLHPEVTLCFVESERRQMLTMLSHRALDAVISVGEGSINAADELMLFRSPVYLVIASDHELAKRDNVSWKDVAELPFLISARESGPDIHDYIVRQATAFGSTVNITRQQVSREGILNLAGLGLGVTVIGDHAAGARYPNVTLIPLGGADEMVPFSLVWLAENDNPALRRFISLARIEAKKNGALS